MLTIEPMQAAQRDAFAEIWIPWLQASMKRTPELEDLVIMADPAAYYREEGRSRSASPSAGGFG